MWYAVEGGGRKGCPDVMLPLLPRLVCWMGNPDGCGELPGPEMGAKWETCGRIPLLGGLEPLTEDPD